MEKCPEIIYNRNINIQDTSEDFLYLEEPLVLEHKAS